MCGQRLGDPITNIRMTRGYFAHLPWQVSARVSSRREEIRMNNNFARALCYELRETFGDPWMLDFEKGRLDHSEAAALANASCRLTHVLIGFGTTAPVTDDQNPCLIIVVSMKIRTSR